MNSTKTVLVSISLSLAVLVGLVFLSLWKDGEDADDKGSIQQSEYNFDDGKVAGIDPGTTASELNTEASREMLTPTSKLAPLIYEDWISESLRLTGAPDVEMLFHVIDRLATMASMTPASASISRISFLKDPNTVGEYSTLTASGIETTKIAISTTAPHGHAIEDPRFDRRELAFEFDSLSEVGSGAPTRITRFSCQVNLVGCELGRMTPAERDDFYGNVEGPMCVGFVLTCSDTQIRIDRSTLEIRQEDDGTYLAYLVGGDGKDAIVLSCDKDPSAANSWRRCTATLDRWRQRIGAR